MAGIFPRKWRWSSRRPRRRNLRRRAKQTSTHTHYLAHKELAREIVTSRVQHWNQVYGFVCGRISIKNQRRSWGSCSEKRNLNFNYKIIFLPETLMDYVIVHELCHIAELNHSAAFWKKVEKTQPEYKTHRAHLRRITHVPFRGFPNSAATKHRGQTPMF